MVSGHSLYVHVTFLAGYVQDMSFEARDSYVGSELQVRLLEVHEVRAPRGMAEYS